MMQELARFFLSAISFPRVPKFVEDLHLKGGYGGRSPSVP